MPALHILLTDGTSLTRMYASDDQIAAIAEQLGDPDQVIEWTWKDSDMGAPYHGKSATKTFLPVRSIARIDVS